MFLKLLIISVFMVAIVMLALGVKLLFDPNAEFSAHSCALESGDKDLRGSCSGCQIKDLANCPEQGE